MEMTKKPPPTTTNEESDISPSPYPSASAEREELERTLLDEDRSSNSSTSDNIATSQNYIPTAVPIRTTDYASFNENASLPTATASIASVPPPSASAAAASSNRANNTPSTKHVQSKSAATTKSNEDKSNSFTDDDSDIIVRPDNNKNLYNLPTASTLPTFTNHTPQHQHLISTSNQLRAANVAGTLSSLDEYASVARAQRQRPNIQQTTTNAVNLANAKAYNKKGARDEGLTVDEGIHHLNLKETDIPQREEDIRPYSKVPGKGGYETKEYETGEYETGEYETSEYKSVYDD